MGDLDPYLLHVSTADGQESCIRETSQDPFNGLALGCPCDELVEAGPPTCVLRAFTGFNQAQQDLSRSCLVRRTEVAIDCFRALRERSLNATARTVCFE